MCFTIREINIHQFDHTGNITKLAVIDSGNNNSTNVDKEIAAITPPRNDGDNQVPTPTTEWRTSETFIRWWRRGLMTALQYKLPLLSPPVSSQPTFRHQNNGLENTLSIQPRVAKLGQDKFLYQGCPVLCHWFHMANHNSDAAECIIQLGVAIDPLKYALAPYCGC